MWPAKSTGKFSTSEKLIRPCDRQHARENIAPVKSWKSHVTRQQARENKAPVKSARKNVTNGNSGKKYNQLVNNYSPKWRWIVVDIHRATFTDSEVNNCFSIYHKSWITSGPKSNFICENVATKAILFFSGCSEVNSTWLITSELANQRARKVLFTCVVYTNINYFIKFLRFLIKFLKRSNSATDLKLSGMAFHT